MRVVRRKGRSAGAVFGHFGPSRSDRRRCERRSPRWTLTGSYPPLDCMPSDASFAPALLGEHRTDTGRAEKLSLALAARAQARRERWPARSRGGTLANPIWMPAGWSGPLGPNGMSSGSVRFRRSVPSNSRQVWIRRLSCGCGQASIASTPLRGNLPSPGCTVGGSGSSEFPMRPRSRFSTRPACGGGHGGCVDPVGMTGNPLHGKNAEPRGDGPNPGTKERGPRF